MAKVTIGCKLPHGLILELISVGNLLQPGAVDHQHRCVLKGANSLREDKRAAQGQFPVAYTEVDEELWDEWYKRNKDLEPVRKGFVFKAENVEGRTAAQSLKAQAKDRLGERTGLEALAVEKDPRMKVAKGVTTDAEHLAAVTAAAT